MEARELRNGTPAGAERRLASLPCLRGNNSIEPSENGVLNPGPQVPVSRHAFKTEFCLKENIEQAAKTYGIERLAFLTITFRKPVYSAKVAQARLNSLLTNVIRPRYGNGYITVFERHASGAVHFHVVLLVARDIRTGFNWEFAQMAYAAGRRREYAQARKFWNFATAQAPGGEYLRGEWAFWRDVAKRYRWLGRCEMLPVRSTAEAVAKYTGGYIAKHMQHRRPEDKGVHLVRYGKGMCWARSRLAFNTPRNWVYRKKTALFALQHGCDSPDKLRQRFGDRWGYRYSGAILGVPLNVKLPDGSVMDAARYAADVTQLLCREYPLVAAHRTLPLPLKWQR